MAEFVDNSLQSYLENHERLQQLHGKDFRLKVEIEIERSDEVRITIRDNASGLEAAIMREPSARRSCRPIAPVSPNSEWA